MISPSLFLISIVQGIFLVMLIGHRRSTNPMASRLIIVLITFIILTNLGYFVAHTGLRNYVPQLFSFTAGTTLLLGPLFYFYSKSVVDPSFRWKRGYWIHFLPYTLLFLFNGRYFLLATCDWADFLATFLAGDLPMDDTSKVMFAVQEIHLFIYLVVIFRQIRAAVNFPEPAAYIIPVSSRVRWLKAMAYSLSLLFVVAFSLYLFVLLRGRYNPITNYIYSLASAGIFYVVEYNLVLNPELISPGFVQKYRKYMPFDGNESETYARRLRILMSEAKVFTNPDLDLSTLAERIGLPAYQVSRLINERFNKSFNDYVNEHRVREFIARVNDPKYQNLSIYGLALEVGFNSKSSFNSAFKKITGKTPSQYRAT